MRQKLIFHNYGVKQMLKASSHDFAICLSSKYLEKSFFLIYLFHEFSGEDPAGQTSIIGVTTRRLVKMRPITHVTTTGLMVKRRH